MSRALTIFIHLLLFGLLVWVCLGHQGRIQGEVADNANAALTAGGFGFARATADGQQVTLLGTAETAAARDAAEQAALGARGVTAVDNQIALLAEVPPPGPDSSPVLFEPAVLDLETPPETPQVQVVEEPLLESLQILLDGTQQRAQVVGLALSPDLDGQRSSNLSARIDAALPGWQVNNAIAATASGPWDFRLALGEVLPTLRQAERAQLDADVEGIRVTATLASFADRTALQATLDALREQPDFATTDLSWKLDSPPAPTDKVDMVDGCQEAFDELLKKDTIMFTTNRAEIRPSSFGLVDKLVEVARDCQVTVAIEGHTDSRGSAALNNGLSLARADTVRSYLIDKGVDGARISAEGLGSAQPIANNNTVDGRQANRRIEFRVKRTDQ